jgi:hypothetical protein
MRFENLRETLLKGGIAPRHVRRYLAELSEHLDDLVGQQHALGYDGEDAAVRARARLGEDRELAAAMLEQKSLRSLPARAPWLIFGLLPPVAGIIVAFVVISPLVLIANGLHMVAPGGIDAPGWFRTLAFAITGAGNLALGPLLAAGFAMLAFRQRMSLTWPLVAILAIALLDLQFAAHFPGPNHRGGSITVGATMWVLHTQTWLDTWPLSVARLSLTLLPIVFLLRTKSPAER